MTEAARTIAFIGATSGLGRAAADQLVKDGHSLVLVGRDPKRVERLAQQLPAAVVIGADVSTVTGIDHAATQVERAVDHLDVLVNNAGVMIPTRQTTREGVELFTYELQRRHSELSVVTVHPGMVRSDLGRHWPRIQVAVMHAMSISACKGAEPVSLATASSVEPGGYYNRFTAARSSAESYEPRGSPGAPDRRDGIDARDVRRGRLQVPAPVGRRRRRAPTADHPRRSRNGSPRGSGVWTPTRAPTTAPRPSSESRGPRLSGARRHRGDLGRAVVRAAEVRAV